MRKRWSLMEKMAGQLMNARIKGVQTGKKARRPEGGPMKSMLSSWRHFSCTGKTGTGSTSMWGQGQAHRLALTLKNISTN